MQDRLDGGISILLCCPGANAFPNVGPEQITVDLYVIPRELVRNKHLTGDTSFVVQAFCQEFVIPHLQRFTEHCMAEGLNVPNLRCKFFFPVPLILLTQY
jgi:hypothetical protein